MQLVQFPILPPSIVVVRQTPILGLSWLASVIDEPQGWFVDFLRVPNFCGTVLSEVMKQLGLPFIDILSQEAGVRPESGVVNYVSKCIHSWS